jgi:hypothetical protein
MSAARAEIAKRYDLSDTCPVCESGSKNCSQTDDAQQFCRGDRQLQGEVHR